MPAPLPAPPPPVAAPACTPYRPAACASINALIVQPGFARALKLYGGSAKADWLYAGGRVGDQLVEVLHGPPDAPASVGADLVRLSACRAHSCPEKGAAFLTSAGRIQAVAVLHFRCAKTCADDYTLSVVTRDPGRFVPLARAWAQAALDEDARQFPASPGLVRRIERVETRAPAR